MHFNDGAPRRGAQFQKLPRKLSDQAVLPAEIAKYEGAEHEDQRGAPGKSRPG